MILLFINPKTGEKIIFPIKNGTTLGRKNTHIEISDSKISSLHAKIEKEGDNFYLSDQGSTNKILYKGVRSDRLELYSGISFQLGNTLFRVFDKKKKTEELDEKELQPSKDKKHWSEYLKDCFTELMAKSTQGSNEIYPFSKDLVLRTVDGPQKGSKFEILYGPRSIGNLDQDMCILDWNIGEASFELVEHDHNIYLTTDFPSEVLVNNASESTVKLSTGDKIFLGQTTLEVEVRSYE